MGQFLSPLVEIGIEVLGLVILPLEILELKTVLTELYGIYLGRSSSGKKENPQYDEKKIV